MQYSVKDIVKMSILAALYVVLTVLLEPISYGQVQIRFSEILVLFCFFNRKYSVAMIIGCFVANLFSPLGIVDLFFGTIGTIFAVYGIGKSKNLAIACIWPVIANGIFVGMEIAALEHISFPITAIYIMAGETIAMIVGYLVITLLMKNQGFKKLICE